MTKSVWGQRVKVIGLSLSIMMLGFWVFSVMFFSSYMPPSRQGSINIAFGRISFGPWHYVDEPGWTCFSHYSRLKEVAAEEGGTWTGFAYWWLGFSLPNNQVTIPVWLFVVAAGFPTAVLWWRDRRPKAGFCKVCKYNLTGNVSGTCPECGTAVGHETG